MNASRAVVQLRVLVHAGAALTTGHLSREQTLEVGERITIGSQSGIVRDVEPLLGEHGLRLVVQLRRDECGA